MFLRKVQWFRNVQLVRPGRFSKNIQVLSPLKYNIQNTPQHSFKNGSIYPLFPVVKTSLTSSNTFLQPKGVRCFSSHFNKTIEIDSLCRLNSNFIDSKMFDLYSFSKKEALYQELNIIISQISKKSPKFIKLALLNIYLYENLIAMPSVKNKYLVSCGLKHNLEEDINFIKDRELSNHEKLSNHEVLNLLKFSLHSSDDAISKANLIECLNVYINDGLDFKLNDPVESVSKIIHGKLDNRICFNNGYFVFDIDNQNTIFELDNYDSMLHFVSEIKDILNVVDYFKSNQKKLNDKQIHNIAEILMFISHNSRICLLGQKEPIGMFYDHFGFNSLSQFREKELEYRFLHQEAVVNKGSDVSNLKEYLFYSLTLLMTDQQLRVMSGINGVSLDSFNKTMKILFPDISDNDLLQAMRYKILVGDIIR